jgi:transketolase
MWTAASDGRRNGELVANSADDEKRINAIRMLSIDAVQKAGSGHPGLPLGAAACAFTLWSRHLRFNPRDPHWPNRDRFVLSAGHGSMLLYSLLYLTGYDVSLDDLKAFRQLGSKTPGHPEYPHTPGVEVTTGPLGQGLANAVGLAIAEAHMNAVYGASVIDHYTYCLASDGDLMEGVASEACSLAGHLKLGKLIVFYDDNHVSLAGPTSVTFTENTCERFEAYGWQTIRVENGNDVAEIDAAIATAKAQTGRPTLIDVRTHIGYGSPKADTYGAHGEPLGEENVRKTKENLGWPTEPPFYVPDDVLAWWREIGARGAELQARWHEGFKTWKASHPELAAQFERVQAGRLPPLTWPSFSAENGALATRDAGSIAMNAIAKSLPELIGGSADLDPSTRTYLKDCGDFEPGTYAGRNIHFGVREHAMGAVVNGIALHGGLLPFGATFFNFLDYMKPAVRLAALSKVHAIFVYTHDSVFLGEDGPTHQPIEQLAELRAQPNTITIRPADALETVEAWKIAIARKGGPIALILTRQKLPFLGVRNADVKRGGYVLQDSDGPPDVILIATGSEVWLAVEAAKLLARKGTKVRVVSLPSWELFAEQDRSYRDSVLPPNVKARISIEAAATLGWERWVGDHGVAIGIDHFGTSAPAGAIAQAFGFVPEKIAETASSLLERV